ncbi:unnamed protein product [Bursaphelenchus okinawaensis]|uniref:C2H2-type domain-containing protein n=1 Tax=Bursaphelenchus okinawaensis TaxID=465554 RepID=A0A811L1G5_9BILA|nr:unnamed protein product [Bursaphelenchus okinawaensis]CAG9114483.1 unnamed protein product [Bursaphelenchus okinawaensis]
MNWSKNLKMAEKVYPTQEELEQKTQNFCKECDKTFVNSSSYNFHMVKTHRQINKPSDVALDSRLNHYERKTFEYYCPVCNNHYSGMKLLVQHYRKVHGEKRFECDVCTAKFALERDLKYHKKKMCIALGESRMTLLPRKSTNSSTKVSKAHSDTNNTNAEEESTKTMSNVPSIPSTSSTISVAPKKQKLIAVKLIPCTITPVRNHVQVQTEFAYNNLNAPCVSQSAACSSQGASMDEGIQTSDFGVQFGTMSYDRECQFEGVSTYDQSTMYEAPSTSDYTVPSYYDDTIMPYDTYNDNNTAATQTYLWSDDYNSQDTMATYTEQQNMGTQTGFESLDQWYGGDANGTNGRDFGVMTDPQWFNCDI